MQFVIWTNPGGVLCYMWPVVQMAILV